MNIPRLESMAMRKFLACLVMCAACVTARADEVQVDALIKQLKDPDSDMRRGAAKKLAELGKDATTAGPALIDAAKNDKDLFVRRFAAQALGDVGADPKTAVPALSALLKEDVKELTEAAIGSLGKMGPAAIPALTDVLKTTDAKTKPKKGDKKAPKTPDRTAFLRSKAAQMLGAMGAEGKDAVPALVGALKDPSIRIDAATALGNIGPAAKDAVSALKDATTGKGNKKDKGFSTAVKEALRKIEKE
jgi:HEAT repeat protein